MLVSVIPIGNSKGIRLPKAILEQLGIQDKLDLEIEEKQIVLKPVNRKPRDGWDILMRRMGEAEEDKLVLPELDEKGTFEWEW
jgi:antitoxin MazE